VIPSCSYPKCEGTVFGHVDLPMPFGPPHKVGVCEDHMQKVLKLADDLQEWSDEEKAKEGESLGS
jgi:hypothetical protein